jgi:hypothetical protein
VVNTSRLPLSSDASIVANSTLVEGPVSERRDRFVGPRLIYPAIPSSVPDELALTDAKASTAGAQTSGPLKSSESQTPSAPGLDKLDSAEPKPGRANADESIAPTARDAQGGRILAAGSSNVVNQVESKGDAKGDARVLGLVVEASAPITPTSFAGSLALTGANSLLLGLVALVLLLAGSAVLKLTKRS